MVLNPEFVKEINVSDFIEIITEYTGDESFLTPATDKQINFGQNYLKCSKQREKKIYDVETKKPSQIDAYGAGYIKKTLEKS